MNVTSEQALKSKGMVYSRELVRALREDSAAQTRVKDEIVGLDFDPFLNGQDPKEKYFVGEIDRKGKSYYARVYGIQAGKRSAKPEVIAILKKRNGAWRFSNFVYPPHQEDLLTVLREPKRTRHASRQSVRTEVLI